MLNVGPVFDRQQARIFQLESELNSAKAEMTSLRIQNHQQEARYLQVLIQLEQMNTRLQSILTNEAKLSAVYDKFSDLLIDLEMTNPPAPEPGSSAPPSRSTSNSSTSSTTSTFPNPSYPGYYPHHPFYSQPPPIPAAPVKVSAAQLFASPVVPSPSQSKQQQGNSFTQHYFSANSDNFYTDSLKLLADVTANTTPLDKKTLNKEKTAPRDSSLKTYVSAKHVPAVTRYILECLASYIETYASVVKHDDPVARALPPSNRQFASPTSNPTRHFARVTHFATLLKNATHDVRLMASIQKTITLAPSVMKACKKHAEELTHKMDLPAAMLQETLKDFDKHCAGLIGAYKRH